MPNKSLPMNKLRTIIRLYTERVGLRAIAELSRTSRNTVKKYVNKWNALSMTYEAFLAKSDAELYSLFCIDKDDCKLCKRSTNCHVSRIFFMSRCICNDKTSFICCKIAIGNINGDALFSLCHQTIQKK